MLDFDKYPIFCQNRGRLRELSRDGSGAEDGYVTESGIEAVDFDGVKRAYTRELGLSDESAASVDALIFHGGRVVFIEFKNGKVVNRDIKSKIRDSLLIFCDIVSKSISDTRREADFVLVYNFDKNPLPNQLTGGMVQESPSREEIAKYFLKKGGSELIRFDLEKYKSLYFREIHTYTKEEFEGYLDKKVRQ